MNASAAAPQKLIALCQSGKSKVAPPVLSVSKGDRIRLLAAGEPVVFWFPEDIFDTALIEVKPGSPADKVVQESAASGVYEYAVYCRKSRTFAEGNSSPIIIIE